MRQYIHVIYFHVNKCIHVFSVCIRSSFSAVEIYDDIEAISYNLDMKRNYIDFQLDLMNCRI